ncbi:MAG: hypothetical protein AB1782_12015 [Cyanobacteriota bacterium]
MSKNLPVIFFIALLFVIIIITNPFTAEKRSIVFDILVKYEEQNSLATNIENLSKSEKLELAEEYINTAKEITRYDKYDKAIEITNNAIFINPDYENIYSQLSNLYLLRAYYNANSNKEKVVDSHDYTLAVEYAERNIKKFPESIKSYDGLISTYVFVDNYDKALETAKKACYSDLKFKHLCHKVSDLYLMKGEKQQAIQFYKELAQKHKNSNIAWIYKEIGNHYEYQGQCEQSQKYYKMAYQMHSTSENLQLLTTHCNKKLQSINDN